MQQLNVVICGFDHYENIDVNPSYEVPEALVRDGIGEPSDVDDPLHDANVSINTVALPVSFANAWPTLLETLDATRPDIVIATGLKHAAHSVAMERCATNLMNAARPDADNALPRFEPIIKDGPAAYWTRLPLRAIINDFARDGIPATLSSDAGTFVCNSLFYQLLHWTATQDRVLAGFVSFLRSMAAAGCRTAWICASRCVPGAMWCARRSVIICSRRPGIFSSPDVLLGCSWFLAGMCVRSRMVRRVSGVGLTPCGTVVCGCANEQV